MSLICPECGGTNSRPADEGWIKHSSGCSQPRAYRLIPAEERPQIKAALQAQGIRLCDRCNAEFRGTQTGCVVSADWTAETLCPLHAGHNPPAPHGWPAWDRLPRNR